jgi:hypothetical protein
MATSDRRAHYNKGSIRLGASLPKRETGLASEMSCCFKKLEDGQSPPPPPKKEDYIS